MSENIFMSEKSVDRRVTFHTDSGKVVAGTVIGWAVVDHTAHTFPPYDYAKTLKAIILGSNGEVYEEMTHRITFVGD